MKIRDFIKTEEGKRFAEILSGCDKNWEVEYWESLADYATCLRDNGWDEEEIVEQYNLLNEYRVNEDDDDFCIVIN